MQKLSISIGSALIIGSVLHYRIRKMASSDLFGTVSDLVDAISDLSAVKYRCNMPPQTLILPIQDTLSYNLGEISDLSFQSALCIQARFSTVGLAWQGPQSANIPCQDEGGDLSFLEYLTRHVYGRLPCRFFNMSTLMSAAPSYRQGRRYSPSSLHPFDTYTFRHPDRPDRQKG